MKEDFLHYVWKYKLYTHSNLTTSLGENLQIVKSGISNFNSGPDFLNAQIKINKQTWFGNIEIHVQASDWYLHNHEIDKNYDAVILHVVWECDAPIFKKNNVPLPVFILKDFVLESAVQNYRNLFFKKTSWIPCENQIKTINTFTLDNWLERLFFERLERKSEGMQQLLTSNKNDYEATLFQLLAKNFGLKINADAFLNLASSFDFSILRKVRFNEDSLAALLFGQAGFLDEIIEEEYHKQLKTEFTYLQHKYNLQSIANQQFYFFRMRPNNFPTIRIAQLASLYFRCQNLFSELIEIKNIEDFYTIFSVKGHHFWSNHYTFNKTSKPYSKYVTKSFIDLVLINTVIPFIFLYQKNRANVVEEDFLDVLKRIKPEKNSIISKFSEIGITAKNSFETQAILELKNRYCSVKRCLDCAVGKTILNRNVP